MARWIERPLTHRRTTSLGLILALVASVSIAVQVRTGTADAAPGDPDATVSFPASGQSLGGTAPFELTGRATDDVGVVRAAVAIRNPATDSWLHADGTWGTFAWVDAVLYLAGEADTGWRYSWTPPGDGTYGMTAQAWDANGNLDSARQWVQFSVSAGSPPTTTSSTTTTTSSTTTTTTTTTQPPAGDTTPPSNIVSVPGANQSFGEGSITFSGSASDDSGLAGIDIAIRDRDELTWLNPNGSWGGFAWLSGDLDSPGATSSGWSHEFTPPNAGDFGMLARARDVAGNTAGNTWRAFTSDGPGGGGPPPGGDDCTPDSPPYAVGEMTMNLVDSARGRSFETTVYYPATVNGAGAPVACGSFPMVMAGHGGSGTGRSAANLFRFLVNDGYVIVGPTFPAGFNYDLLAGDVSFVLTAVIAMRPAGGPLGQLDPENIGFIGTSKGASIGYATYLACCVDDRIDAVIPRAGMPPGGPFDYANGAALLIINGDADEFAPWVPVVDFYNAAVAPKGLIRLAGVGHDLNVGPHGILQDAPRGFFDFILKGDPSGIDAILNSVNTNPLATIQFDW